MILYHGTNVDFQQIDIRKSNPYKDFGQGFYLTDILVQAENMAAKHGFLAEVRLYRNINLMKRISRLRF